MTTTELNLLTDPLLDTETPGGERMRCDLPTLLARWSRREVCEPTALQAHQQHAWHAFTTQLAALALVAAREAGDDYTLAASPDAWRARLRRLTGGRDEPYCLVVRDLAQPAFLQSPVPEGALTDWKSLAHSDELDVLATAKNHDVKGARVRAPSPELWVYALVSLQTTQGRSGRDNHGIARMNSGYGSRPGFGVAAALDSATRFARDVPVLIEAREKLLKSAHGYARTHGVALLWLLPWDGTPDSALGFDRLDPLFIEVCRRVRLERTASGALVARTRSTRAARINAGECKGNTGDPWTPVRSTDAAALTVPRDGLHYERMCEILFEEAAWKQPPALEVRDTDGPAPLVIARVLVRGQGKTEGYHERVIPLKGTAPVRLRQSDGRRALAERSRYRVGDVATLRQKILKPALLALVQGGPEKLKIDSDVVEPWLEALDTRVDAVFFDHLFEHLEREAADDRRAWRQEIHEIARALLEEAIDALPIPQARRYRAITHAYNYYFGGLRKHLPEALPAPAHVHHVPHGDHR